MKFFYTHVKDNDDSKIAESDESLPFEFIDDYDLKTRWPQVTFYQKSESFSDYLNNDKGWLICSEKLKNILETEKDASDEVLWLPIIIESSNGTGKGYYVMFFPKYYDVVDKDNTLYYTENCYDYDEIVRLCLNLESVDSHCVFAEPGNECSLIISEDVKNKIMQSNCTGIEFSSVKSN